MVCLVPVALCLAATANAAAERPVPPLLTGTNPASSATAPASSLSPSVLGESEPVIIKESAPLGVGSALTLSALNPTKNPNFVIEIFSGEECQGSAIGQATAGVFDLEGIPVGVVADQKSTFSARQVDPANPSEPSFCSGPGFYWEGNVPPEAGASGGATGGGTGGGSGSSTSAPIGPATPVSPVKPQAPRIHTEPGGVANDTAPLVVGSTRSAESVLLYAAEGCKGSPIAKGSVSQLESGFQVSATPNSTTTFSAAAIVGQRSACSEPVSYTEDSTAPRTLITMAPGVKTRKRKAVFRFRDVTEDQPGTTFVCKVDKKAWKGCASPFRVKHLKYGHHVVKIRATDLAGNRERKPVKRRFIVVRPGRP
ncbi:MAG: hypothetical protein JST59_27400 [Actinobacteria bacterium]|nr:hypothetical protein [Actinomycetota bacterium]